MNRLMCFLALAAMVATLRPAVAEVAVFTGGCFWCMEDDFARIPGVIAVETGYAGEGEASPLYEDVASGRSGHLFAVRMSFDPTRLSYGRLLDGFWRQIDPVDAEGQFCERGRQYRAAIIALDQGQLDAARASLAWAEGVLGRPPAVEIRFRTTFWPAEAEQQDFALRNPRRYDFFRRSCGIDDRLREIWASPR